MQIPFSLSPAKRRIHNGSEARRHLLKGAQVLAKAVSVTYGPFGRTVLMDRMAGLLATKDGVTVAREIDLEHHVQNMGCQILKECCVKVNTDAGDGTTSTAIIAAALIEEGNKLATAGLDPMQIAAAFKAAAECSIDLIRGQRVSVQNQKDLEHVAMIASNGDIDVSAALAEACMAVGRDGTVAIEDGRSVGIELVFKEGMEIDRGVAAGAFLGTSGSERILEGPLVAVIGGSLTKVEDVQSVMEIASQWPQNHLLVFCEDISGDALKMAVMNDQQGVMHNVFVPSPGFHGKKKDYLKDLAALAGADFIDPEVENHQSWDADWFGGLRQATLRDRSSTLVAYEEAEEIIATRVEEIRNEMNFLTSEFDRDKCKERLAKLSGGLCIMQVGGYTEAELKERRARIEDALGAVQAALAEGVLPGAGTSYLFASEYLLNVVPEAFSEDPSYMAGWNAFAKALQRPLKVLAQNAGFDGPEIVQSVLDYRQTTEQDEFWCGWDAKENKIRRLSDEPAIYDPVPVFVAVLRAAASVAGMLLTVEASISQSNE